MFSTDPKTQMKAYQREVREKNMGAKRMFSP